MISLLTLTLMAAGAPEAATQHQDKLVGADWLGARVEYESRFDDDGRHGAIASNPDCLSMP